MTTTNTTNCGVSHRERGRGREIEREREGDRKKEIDHNVVQYGNL